MLLMALSPYSLMLRVVLFLSTVLPVSWVSASPARASVVTHAGPEYQALDQPSSAYGFVRLNIGLRQSRFHELERRLYEVAEPGSSRFRQHLSQEEVEELIKPTEDTISAVEEWLLGHQVNIEQLSYSSARDWITITVPASTATALLGTHDSDQGQGDLHPSTWPAKRHKHMSRHIDWIQPSDVFLYAPKTKIDFPRSIDIQRDEPHEAITTDLNQAAEHLSHAFEDGLDLDDLPKDLHPVQACNTSAVTPLCVRTLYGTLGYTPSGAKDNSMALVNFDSEFNNRSDIDLFLRQFRPDAARGNAASTFSEENIGGGINWQRPATPEQLAQKTGREGNVDAQALLSIAWPVPMITYSVGSSLHPPFAPDLYTPTNTNEPFLIWLNDLLQRPDSALPKVLSISYGDIEHTVPLPYAQRVCNGFAQLGARGVTVIFGAGDSGVGKEGYCRSNDGTNVIEFLTSFPASCPFGTSVGATRQTLVHSTSTSDHDINVNFTIEDHPAHNPRNGFVTGGGFSKYFPRPAYQDAAVQFYLNATNTTTSLPSTHSKDQPLFDPEGRGYPDVSISGYRRITTWNGTNYLVDGTSVSAPTFAAVVALVNDALLSSGSPSLGFLNPWLYSVGHAAFRDITSGNNSGCGTAGFVATEGWDPVTGWGVPRFPRFLELALQHTPTPTPTPVPQDQRPSSEIGVGQRQKPWYWYGPSAVR